jgi:hypothetical protein
MSRARLSESAESGGLLLKAVLVAAVVCLALSLAAETPRGRLNIMQYAAVTVFLLAAWRSWRPAGTPPLPGQPQNSAWTGLAPALIAGALVWAPMLPFYFIAEDFEHVMAARRPMLPSLLELLTRGQIGVFLRPFGFLSIFVDHRLFGESPFGYHVTNLAIHLLTAAAIYHLCVHAEAPRPLAAGAALIYAVLPIHVEAVAWMGARFDQLSACLATWAVAFYLQFRRRGQWGAYAACIACVPLALLSKENAFAIPLLILAAEWRLTRSRRYWPALAVAGVTAMVFGYRWIVLGGVGGYHDPAGRPIALSLGFKTLEGLLVRGPSQTMLGYNWHQPAGLALIIVVSLTAALLLAAAWHNRPDRDGRARLLFGFAWVVVASAPAHSMLFIDASLMNSRVLHFGSVGMALFVAQLMHGIRVPRLRQTATALLAGLLGAGALHNLAAWRWTSELTRNTLTELRALDPSPRPGTRYVFHDMPATVRGVYFLGSGLTDSIRLSYGRDDLSADRAGSPAPAETPVIHVQWKETPPLVKRVDPPSE